CPRFRCGGLIPARWGSSNVTGGSRAAHGHQADTSRGRQPRGGIMRTWVLGLAALVLVVLVAALLLRVVADPPPRVFDDTGEDRPTLPKPPPPAWIVAAKLE